MTQKALVIKIQGVDATAPATRSATLGLRLMGNAMTGTFRGALNMTSATVRAFTSLKTIIGSTAIVMGLNALRSNLASTVDRLDELGERARQLRLDLQQYQVLEYIAKRQNIQADKLFAAFSRGQAAIASHEKLLKAYGTSAYDAAGNVRPLLSVLEQLDATMQYRGMNQNSRWAVMSQLLGGKAAGGLERILAAGPMSGYTDELKKLGGIVSAKDVARAQAMSDAMDRLSVSTRGLKEQLVLSFAPAMTEVMNTLAFRLGALPDQIRGIGVAFNSVRTKGPGYQDAQELLSDLYETGLTAVKTTVIELAKIGANTFVMALKGGLLLVWPAIFDLVKRSVITLTNDVVGAMPETVRKYIDWKPITEGGKSAELASLRAILDRGNDINNPDVMRFRSAYEQQARLESMPMGDELSRMNDRRRGPRWEMQDALRTLNANGQTIEFKIGDQTYNAIANGKDLIGRIAQLTNEVKGEKEAFARTLVADAEAIAIPWVEANKQSLKKIFEDVSPFNKALGRAGNFFTQYREKPADVLPMQTDGVANYGAEWKKVQGVVQSAVGGVGTAYDFLMNKQRSLIAMTKEIPLFFAANDRKEEIRIAMMRGRGNSAGADMAELLMGQRRETADARAQYGGAFNQFKDQLRELQQLQIRKLTLDQSLLGITDKLNAIDTQYNRTLEERASLVDTGTLREREAAGLNRQMIAGTLTQLDDLKARLATLRGSTGSDLQGLLNPVGGDIQAMRERLLARQRELSPGTIRQGIMQSFDDVQRRAADLKAFGYDVSQSLVTSFGQDLPNALLDAAGGVRSLKDAFRDFGASTLRSLAQVAAQMLAIRMISSAIGFFSGSSLSPLTMAGFKNTAGTLGMPSPMVFPNAGMYIDPAIRRYGGGGFVSSGAAINRDTVPALLTYAEGVTNQRATRRLGGKRGIDALNAGADPSDLFGGGRSGSGGITFNITVNVGSDASGDGVGGSPFAVKRAMTAAVREAVVGLIEKDATVRQMIRYA